jgi:peroxiredoxin
VEAGGFRDRIQDFHDRNTVLLGVTFSPVVDLRRWREELGLACDLLSDEDRQVGLAWGAATSADQEKAARVSVLIGAHGTVMKTYPSPDPSGHAQEVLDDL